MSGNLLSVEKTRILLRENTLPIAELTAELEVGQLRTAPDRCAPSHRRRGK